MPRTAGARDIKPRIMHPNSLKIIQPKIPGMTSVAVRIYGSVSDVRWFERMSPMERGDLVAKVRKL